MDGRLLILNVQYLSLFIANPPVEFFPFDAQEVLSRVDDATFNGNGSGGVNVVTSDHSHCDASTLTFTNSFWHLWALSSVLLKILETSVGTIYKPVLDELNRVLNSK